MEEAPQEQYKFKLDELELNPIQEKGYSEVICPKCNQGISGAGININDKIAKCDPCGVIFSLQNDVDKLIKPVQVKQEIIRPEGIDIFYFKDELDITFQQPFTTGEGLLLGMGIPMALLISFVAITKTSLFAAGIALLLWLVSIYPIYSLITHKKSKIFISVNERFLNIEWRPRKGNKDQYYDTEDIDQLYVRKNAGTGYHDVFVIINGPEGQKHVRLIPHLDSLSKAKYLEQEIERHLEIPDRRVLEENA